MRKIQKKEKSHRYRGSEAHELYWQKLREEKEKESKKEKEIEKENEEEKKNHESLNFNIVSSSIGDLTSQELKDESPEGTSYELPRLKKKSIDIILSDILYIRPIFGSQTREDKGNKQMKFYILSCQNHLACIGGCLGKNTKAHYKHIGDGLHIFLNSKERIQEPREEYKTATTMHKKERFKSKFVQIVFDPGGKMNQ